MLLKSRLNVVKLLRAIFSRENIVGIIIAVLMFRLALLIGSLPGLRKLELGFIDDRYQRYSFKFSLKNSPIVVVDADDVSNEALHAVWPWPRSYYARVIKNLFRAGARAVILDIIMDKAMDDDPEGDDSLSTILRRYDSVVLGGKIMFIKNIGIKDETRLLMPYEKFLNADTTNWGLVDVPLDIDGVVREYYNRCEIPGSSYRFPSLAVRAYEMLQGCAHPQFHDFPKFKIAFPGGARTFPYFSFYQVIDDSAFWTKDEEDWNEENNWFYKMMDESRFRDKIVFVGSSIAELQDRKLTPFSDEKKNRDGEGFEVPGVEIHAAALHTLLNGYVIKNSGVLSTYLLLAIVCLCIYLLTVLTRAWIYFLAAALFSLLWYWGAFKVFEISTTLVPITDAFLSIWMVTAGQMGHLFYLEQLRRKKITGMFGQYVPREVVRELVRNPEKMRLGGERREMTVMFSDVAGFTTISESMTPERLVELLNEYLTAMTGIVHENGGIIDKYEGDLIMAEFGIPIIQPDHAIRACRTAFEMQKRLHGLREVWEKTGKPVLRARTGIGSGQMVFGNMGSNQAFDYTVMGDIVNLASRLEGANKNYGTQILINELTYEYIKDDMLAREMDLLRVKGKLKPVKCYHLMAPNDSPKAEEIRRVCRLFTEGLYCYRSQMWDDAIRFFGEALAIWADDEPSKVYMERCRDFKKSPPGKDWNGVYVMTTK